MNIEAICDQCLSMPGVTEGFPFGEDVLVYKEMNKMFVLTSQEGDPPYVNLKCAPGRAIELLEQFEDIQPGWHMNKVIMELFDTVKRFLRVQLLNTLSQKVIPGRHPFQNRNLLLSK